LLRVFRTTRTLHPGQCIAIFNLLAGYLGAMALGLIAIKRGGLGSLARQIGFMPLYWLLISAAAYRALWQRYTAPYLWEKTEHGLTRPEDLTQPETPPP
jgi:glycosyltransferase XagB